MSLKRYPKRRNCGEFRMLPRSHPCRIPLVCRLAIASHGTVACLQFLNWQAYSRHLASTHLHAPVRLSIATLRNPHYLRSRNNATSVGGRRGTLRASASFTAAPEPKVEQQQSSASMRIPSEHCHIATTQQLLKANQATQKYH